MKKCFSSLVPSLVPNPLLVFPKIPPLIQTEFVLYEDFITEKEEESLVHELEPILKKIRYESSHWDNAILSYRETEKSRWTPVNQALIERIKKLIFIPTGTVEPLDHVHILDLSKDGEIKPHVDSVRFCGRIIGGLSLLSDSVMRLTCEKNKAEVYDAHLKRRSLYVMKDSFRYDFSHQVLSEKESKFRDNIIKRDRRISIIVRCQPRPEDLVNES